MAWSRLKAMAGVPLPQSDKWAIIMRSINPRYGEGSFPLTGWHPILDPANIVSPACRLARWAAFLFV
jgi:hypothetical protein